MYIVDPKSKNISLINQKTFSELGYKERYDLQERLSKSPDSLGEDLLIIQKEFAGFDGTQERLDLLAIDKQGNLVIIENKLDDTGRDVVRQSVKYASYCATLNKEQIMDMYQKYLGTGEDAKQKISDFFDGSDYDEIALNKGQTQRIMLVAANFRKEVVSAVLWLLNYNIRIQCFQTSIYELQGNHIFDINQLIPTKGTEDYVVRIADKNTEEIKTKEILKDRHHLRLEFWKKLLEEANKKTDLLSNISATKDHRISIGSGVSGVVYSLVATNYYCCVEIFIRRPDAKIFFDTFMQYQKEIELEFGHALERERLNDKKGSRIKYSLEGVDIFDKTNRNKMINFMIENIIKLDNSSSPYIKKVKKSLDGK